MRFVAESVIPAPPERVFAFHRLPDALKRLTPDWAGVRVLDGGSSVEVGSRTRIRLRVAPLIWTDAEFMHTVCDPPHRFEDCQIRGPWRSWHHRHIIAPHPEGSRLVDDIEFEPPGGVAGRFLAPVLILPRLTRIFAYRHDVTRAYCQLPSDLC